MRITLTPQYAPARPPLTLIRAGETLTINGAVLDLSGVPEGGTLTDASIDALMGAVTREAGVLRLTLLLPYGAADAPEAARFPAPITDPPDGPVALPAGAPDIA